MGRPAVQIPVGSVFGTLTTIGPVFLELDLAIGKRRSKVPVRCSCGSEQSIWTHNIRNVGTSSCGSGLHHRTDRQCSRDGCTEPHFGLGCCRRHYNDLVSPRESARSRAWRQRNPEANRAHKIVRRHRAREGMTSEDVIISIAYRKIITDDRCFYCSAEAEHDDHFFPLAKGGTDHWYNLVRACRLCNQRKHDRCGTWFLLRSPA